MDFSGTNSINMKPIFGGYPFQGLWFFFLYFHWIFWVCSIACKTCISTIYMNVERYECWEIWQLIFYQYSSTIVTQFVCLIIKNKMKWFYYRIYSKVWLKYFRMKRSCSLIKIVFLKLRNENKAKKKTLFKVDEILKYKLQDDA